MNDLNRSRNRIKSRKREPYYQEKTSGFNWFYRVIILLMILSTLTLGYKINEKKQFVKIPETLILKVQNISQWFPFENWFSLNTHSVASTLNYQQLLDNYYVNGSTQCSSVLDGVVLNVENDEHRVLVKHDNGVLATYGNLETLNVKENDRILKGNILGNFNESLTMDFVYNDQSISYDEAILIK